MTFTPASPASLAAFVAIVVVVAAALPAGTWWAHRRLGFPATRPTLWVTLLLIAWLALTSSVVASGVIKARPMPGIPLFLGTVTLAALLLALSPLGGRLAAGLPLAALVAFQSFRVPLELVLHAWANHGTIPRTMTWTGQNLDIITGIVTLLAAAIVATTRRPLSTASAWFANVVGIVLLVNVARVAVMSSPLPFAWGVHPPLQLVMHLPYALIGPVCVAGALAGHVILTRALLMRTRKT